MRLFALSIAIAMICPLLTGCSSVVEEDALYPDYQYYTEIPGVTDEQIAAVEAIKAERGELVIGMNHSTDAFLREDGSIGGYTALLCGKLTELFGIAFRPEILEWEDLIEGLTSYEVDFSGELTVTPDRLKHYKMTSAIAERSINVFRLRGSETLLEIANRRELRLASLEGSTTAAYIEEATKEDYVPVYVSDYDTVVRMLREQQIDAFFEESSAEAAFDDYPDIVSENYFPLVYTPVSLSTANPALAVIIEIVEQYLNQGAIYHLTALYNEGEQEYRQQKFMHQLTDEERQYLRNHGDQPVHFAAETDNYPSSFYNQTEGEWQGIAIDVLKEIEGLTGLRFEPANGSDATWPELLQMLQNGEVALISELIPSDEREGQFLWPDEPYSVDQYALISRAEQEIIRINQLLYSRVAVPINTAYEEIFDEWFPDHPQKVRYVTTDECFLALENGDVDFVMASRSMMLSMTNYAEKPGFKVNILFDYPYESSFGFNREQGVLCEIIEKAQRSVDTAAITDHWTHKVFDYRAKIARTQRPYLIGLTVLLVAVLVLLISLLMRRSRAGKELAILVRQRTEELEIQTEAARQASLAKSEFLSRMSHEIRTPLNAIIGMAQVGRQIPDLPAKSIETTDEILTASRHLLGILNDILDMAKIESGKFSLSMEPFLLKKALDEIDQIIAPRCREKQIEYIADYPGLQDIGVSGDKLRLKQVLINLLGNAVKFTGLGGFVRLRVAIVGETEQFIDLSFEVEDDGIGMTKEQTDRLFVAFEQADETVAVKYGGTGLGLAISQNMVQKMGGLIRVDSRQGEGSRFYFDIRMEKAEVTRQAKAEEGTLDLSGRRILLVEDIEINRLILAELLSDTKVRIEEAEDGVKAVEAFRDAPPYYFDMIFMDVQMPGMDGYEATRRIRAMNREDAASIPIVAMTANAYKEDIDRALDSGMNGHVAKPIDMDVVRDVLRKYLIK